MKKFLVSIVAILSLVLITGCGGKTNALVGTWEGETNDGMKTTFTFKSNGNVSYENEFGVTSDGTYEITDDSVEIKLTTWTKVYKFEVKDDTLTLTATDKLSPSYDNMKKKK